MLIYNENGFKDGYNSIVEIDGKHSNMLMDFGIIRMSKGTHFVSDENKERAFLLMSGSVSFSWEDKVQCVSRTTLLDELPYVLQVARGVKVVLKAESDVEICLQKVYNENDFEAVFYAPDMIRNQRFGAGTMQDTSTRIVRTVFDAENAPFSEMVLGEVINFPGKWSSYPPHNHPQPEVYHYRFPLAKQGFGFGEVGGNVYKIKHESTLIIDPLVEHPQTAAPGYPMYYVWMIPHLKKEKFGANSRQFLKEHEWLLDEHADIWTDKGNK